MNHPPLFHKRKDGKWQTWWIEQDNDKLRTHSGHFDEVDNCIIESSHVISEWKTSEPTNVGRSNFRDGKAQADFDVERTYKKKREEKYVDSIGEERAWEIKPMLAATYKDSMKIPFPAFSQPKLDGIRAIVTKEGIFSRSWKPIVSVPHIFKLLEPYVQETPLDGELYNHQLKEDFNSIISLTRKTKVTARDLELSEKWIQFWCFDVIEDGKTFNSRSETLDRLNDNISDASFVVTPTTLAKSQEELDDIYSGYQADGFEGQMIRFAYSEYEYSRSSSLLKRKEFTTAEYRITKIEQGTGNWAGFAKRVFCTDGNVEFVATLKNNQQFCKQVLEEADDYINGDVTVQYQNLTPDGIPRFPIAIALYKGKRDL